MNRIDSIQSKLEAKTRRWWFFVGLIALQFVVLPFSSKGFFPEKTGEIIGGAIVGPEASELLHELIAVMHFRGTVQDLMAIPHYHPTLSEILTYPAEELAERLQARESD